MAPVLGLRPVGERCAIVQQRVVVDELQIAALQHHHEVQRRIVRQRIEQVEQAQQAHQVGRIGVERLALAGLVDAHVRFVRREPHVAHVSEHMTLCVLRDRRA